MKIKKVISGIMAVLVVFGTMPVFNANPVQDYAVTANAAETYENLKYEKYSDYVEITGCDKSATEVVIPAEIEGLPVTSIGDMAFYIYSSLTLITIPDSVTNIGDFAFLSCSGLTSIAIPDSVTSIGKSAFASCSSLTSITIPDSVTDIGECAFSGCSGLISVTLPESITSIEDSVFGQCSNLESITIPDSVISISSWAFYNCSSLTSITIPDSVTSISSSAFSETPWFEAKQKENPLVVINNILIDGSTCEGDVVIPDGVTNISNGAFFLCKGLTSITIPDSVTSINNGAFSGCESLMLITIQNPNCEICDYPDTICNGYNKGGYFNGTIYGYENSTAQEYAEKYGYKFEAIDGEIEAPETILGDANCDGEISVADATLILQYCGNKDKYKLTEQGIINADVDGTAGISPVDALIIQQADAGIYSLDELPLKK